MQAVKLAKEIGARKTAKELGIPVDTLYGWQKAVWEGRLEAGPGSRLQTMPIAVARHVPWSATRKTRWSDKKCG